MSIIGGDYIKKVVAQLQETAKERGKGVGQQWGTPADGEAVSNDHAVQLWNYRNPQVDPIILQQLMGAGQHAQAVQYVYPYRLALIGHGDLKQRVERAARLAELAMQPVMPPPGVNDGTT